MTLIHVKTIVADDAGFYTDDEVTAVIESLPNRKLAFCGTYVALKAPCSGGRHLSKSLMNLAHAFGITATYIASRQCNPIKKSGGAIVYRIKCLRPVCQGTELAALQDGLLLMRHARKLILYWGPDQYGGVWDSQAPVLGAVLLGELRIAAGLFTVFFTDQQHGYDVVPKDGIRLHLFQAGVRGRSWLVIDSQLTHDRVRLALFTFVSRWRTPSAGIGQGKRLSSHSFNTAAKGFKDIVSTLSHEVGAPTSRNPSVVLEAANRVSPAACGPINYTRVFDVLPSLQQSRFQLRRFSEIISSLPNAAERHAAIDLFCAVRVLCLQYSDDNFIPASSDDQNCSVWESCEHFTCKHGPRFHMGPGKSASMPLSGSHLSPARRPSYLGALVEVVAHYTYIGVILPNDLSGDMQLQQSLARWHASFNKLLASVTSKSIPRMFLASLVPTHVCTVAL